MLSQIFNTETLNIWTEYLIRFSHLVAGIAWIGSSFYFIWLDSSFEIPSVPRRNVEGELYMVHGGFYYLVEKRKIFPGELPKILHWFKWEATLTVFTGYLLLIWLYYLKGAALLTKPGTSLSQWESIALSLGIIICGWLIYDQLWKRSENKILNVLGTFIFIFGFIFLNLHFFSARGAFIQTGAMLGSMMLLNVWVRILPGQKKMIRDAQRGLVPDTSFSVKAKTRSVHNTYFTFPVLFIMLSNHYPSVYNHTYNWFLLILIGAAGALVRHAMVTKNKIERWALLPALIFLLFILFINSQSQFGLTESTLGPVTYSQVESIFKQRCQACHSSHPTDDIFQQAPKGIVLESESQIMQYRLQIFQQVVVGQTMPLANKTQMTDTERQEIAVWLKSLN